ncbi:MAG: HAD family hydrolase [Ruegeria sp.]
MTVKALIFDVDGTLSETEEAHRIAFNHAFDEAGIGWHWTVSDYTALLRVTGGKERMRAHRDAADTQSLTDAEIAALHDRKTQIYARSVAAGQVGLRPGVAELIASARAAGLRLAIATTTSRPNVDALCRACWGCPAHQIFDVIASGDEVPAKKPAPDVYQLALDRLGLPAKACLAIEDSANGVRSARAAGIEVLVTPSAYTAGDDFQGARWFIPNLLADHLPDVLRFGVDA